MSSRPDPFEFGHIFEIYVPTQCRCGKVLPEQERNEVLEEVKATMAGWFGGSSTERIEGAYLHDRGDLAKEPVDVVRSFATNDAFEEHYEDFTIYVARLANRLTQEDMLCRIDEKRRLYPATENPTPHRCMGGSYAGELPTPLQPDEKARMRSLQASLQRISSIRDARDLFCNVLHYDRPDDMNAELPMVNWPDKLKACLAPGTAPRIIADEKGFKILYLQLAEGSLRKGSERQLVQRIIKDDPTLRGLVVVSDVDQKEWHLVNAEVKREEDKPDRLRLRRMRVGPGQSVRTAVERLSDVDVERAGDKVTAAQLQELHNKAFDVEKVSKEFFNEISNWYFWALTQVEFPTGTLSDDDDEKHRATSLIRFLTRIIFCWFLKEKDLIPASLFREKDLADILTDLDPDSCTYHQGILQNLFFATLNQRMGKDSKGKPHRAFAKDEGFLKNKSTYGVDTLYRYEEHFQEPDKALSHFADVPFLNGGLFECLDRTDEDTGKKLYVDGFSRNKKKRACVPNELFFSAEQTVDLSGKNAYGAPKFKKAKVRGLLNILHAYNFTVEENTPIDEEIALDPELLGKVFENLLASYNDETKTTARKQTGSFYTPRPIVEYMVDESLKAHLTGALTTLGRTEEEAREQLDLILGYTDEEPSLSEGEIDALLEAIHTCKILDPACGSGAFPIGMLQKLVHVVHKLDPENDKFEAIQIREAQKIENRDERRKQIEQIGRDFAENDVDYGRKLYLIENCLYGVDIQPIAIQISKLRFFISLICDQKTNRDKAKNHGIRALPNLETKFVAANTLIGLPEFNDELLPKRAHEIEAEIESLYHRHFSVQRRDQKLKIQDDLKTLRKELGHVLAESLGSSQKAQHLADWNPFDSQASSDFFDPHWMFGQSVLGGFCIIIGNPPYGGVKISDAIKDNLELGSKDIYGAFIAKSLRDYLANDGLLCLIVSDTFMTIKTHRRLREQILNHKIHSIIRVHSDTFKATVNTAIILLRQVPNDLKIPDDHSLLMADLTRVNIHEHYARFMNLLGQTTKKVVTDADSKPHSMAGKTWWSVSTPDYGFYHYPQDLIRNNSNLPFFVASPKIFALANDTCSPITQEQIGDKKVPVRSISLNGRIVVLAKLRDIAEVKVGLQTGDNESYLFQNPQARGNYRSTKDYRSFLLTERDLERICSDQALRLQVIKRGISKDDRDSPRYFGGRYIAPYDKGGESDSSGGWMPYYWVPTDYFLDWSELAVDRMKTLTLREKNRLKGKSGGNDRLTSRFQNQEFYFVPGLTWSDAGVYSPTFRMSGSGVFDVKGSRFIINSDILYTTLGIVCSKLAKMWIKTIENHSVSTQSENIRNLSIPVATPDTIDRLARAIIEKQKLDPLYDFANNEQIEIDRAVYEAYGLSEEDIQEVENWYARRYPKLVAAGRNNSDS